MRHHPIPADGPLRRAWHACDAWWRRVFRPVFTIRIPAGRLPARGCRFVNWLLNEWLIPVGIGIAVSTVFGPLTWQDLRLAIPATTAAVFAVYKIVAIRLRPAQPRR